MTNKELAVLLHTTEATLWRWKKKGSAPFCAKTTAQSLMAQGKLTIIPKYLELTEKE